MSKEDVLKLVVGLLLLAVVAGAFAPDNKIVTTISSVAVVLVIVGAISLGVERGTELLKIVLRFAFKSVGFLKFLQPTGAGSVVLAFIVSYAGVNGFDVSVFDEFEAFANLDAQLIQLLTVALTWLGSSLWHSALPEGAGKAQEVG